MPNKVALNDYQLKAMSTAFYPNVGANIEYVALGLGEAGELQGHIKKISRDDHGVITPQRRYLLLKELGDITWYIAAVCSEARLSMGDLLEYIPSNVSYPPTIEKVALGMGMPVGLIQHIVQGGHGRHAQYILPQPLANLLWSVAATGSFIQYSLDDILAENLHKLSTRKENDTLSGSGDDR